MSEDGGATRGEAIGDHRSAARSYGVVTCAPCAHTLAPHLGVNRWLFDMVRQTSSASHADILFWREKYFEIYPRHADTFYPNILRIANKSASSEYIYVLKLFGYVTIRLVGTPFVEGRNIFEISNIPILRSEYIRYPNPPLAQSKMWSVLKVYS